MFKFLHPSGCTFYDGKPYPYATPPPDKKYGPWERDLNPGPPDGRDCGPGGRHFMKHLSAVYAPSSWWPWWAEVRGCLGESDEKGRYTEWRLRRITPAVFARMLRPPFNWGQGADLRRADLRRANLRGAHLQGADLQGADLRRADLWGANLRGAALWRADLWRADLRGANLRGAGLWRANLRGADLRGADLQRARSNQYTHWPAAFDATAAGVKEA